MQLATLDYNVFNIYCAVAHSGTLLCLTNVQFIEADLMILEGIDVPEGGFDVIYSSGVLHHLSDPLIGLQNLEKILA